MKITGKFHSANLQVVFLAAVLVGLTYILLRINLIDIPLERDEGTFGYFGQTINSGGLPYRDVVDNKPPVTFYLYALALNFLEPTARNIHLLMHGYNLLTLIALFAAARLCYRSVGAAFWTAFIYAIYTSTWSVEGFAATTEVFMLLPLTLSLWTSLVANDRRQLGWMFISGAFGALACWTKQVAIFSVLGILVLALSDAWAKRSMPGHDSRRPIAWVASAWFSGVLVISLIIILPFWRAGALSEMYYWVFLHGLSYVQQSGNILENMARVAQWIKEGLPTDTLPLVFGMIAPWLFIRKSPRESLFVIGFLGLSLVGTIPGYQYKHYFLQLAPAIALAAGWSLHNSLILISYTRTRQISSGLIAILILVATVASNADYYLRAKPFSISRVFFGVNPFPESIPVAEYLKQHASPEDKIFVFGSEPQILFLAERESASKFVPIYPLFQNFPRQTQFQEEAWDEINNSKPSYIVVSNTPQSFAKDGGASKWFEQRLGKLLEEKYLVVAWVPVSPAPPQLRIVSGNEKQAFKEMAGFTGLLVIAKRIKD